VRRYVEADFGSCLSVICIGNYGWGTLFLSYKIPADTGKRFLDAGERIKRRREERIGPRAGNAREKGGLLEKTGQKSQRGGYAFDKTISRRDESNRRKTNRASVYRPPCAANKKTCRSQKRAVGLAINRRSIIPM